MTHQPSFARSLTALEAALERADSYASLDACALALTRLGAQITAALEMALIESIEANAA